MKRDIIRMALLVAIMTAAGLALPAKNNETIAVEAVGRESDTMTAVKSSGNPVYVDPDMDSYVDSDDADSNFGGQDFLYAGKKIFGRTTTYLHYNFSKKPATLEKAYLRINPNIIYETSNATVYLVDENDNWDEYTITYLNRPTNIIDQIDTVLKFEDDNWVDITNFFTEHDLSELNIAINLSVYHENYVSFVSREMGSSITPAIQLVFVQPGDYLDTSHEYYETSDGMQPKMDSYINSGQSESNYGGLDSTYIGNGYSDEIYAAIFRFQGIPKETTKMEFSLYLYGVSETTNVLINIITEDDIKTWQEFDLTWQNWPYASVINYTNSSTADLVVRALDDGVITANLDKWIGNTSIDIIVTLDITTEDTIYAYSREGGSWLCQPPTLKCDKPADTTDNNDEDSDSSESSPEDSDYSNNGTNNNDQIPGFPTSTLALVTGLSLYALVHKKKREC